MCRGPGGPPRLGLDSVALRAFEETAEEPPLFGGLRFLHALRLNCRLNRRSRGCDRRRRLLLRPGMVEGLVLLEFGPRRESQVAVWTLQSLGHPASPLPGARLERARHSENI